MKTFLLSQHLSNKNILNFSSSVHPQIRHSCSSIKKWNVSLSLKSGLVTWLAFVKEDLANLMQTRVLKSTQSSHILLFIRTPRTKNAKAWVSQLANETSLFSHPHHSGQQQHNHPPPPKPASAIPNVLPQSLLVPCPFFPKLLLNSLFQAPTLSR